jgi:uncharacterized protein (TIGR03382 family)
VDFSAAQVFEPVGFIESPEGHGNVAMVQGYLMAIYSSDGGGNADNGGIEFWDVSDPTLPQLVIQYDNADTHGLREAHGFSLSWVDDVLVLAAQGIDGIQFWDVTEPLQLELLSYLDLPGIDKGDYSGDWWLFWQAPIVYVAGVDSGLYVVDAADPANPVLVNQVQTGDLAGISPAQVFALGNLMVIMESQQLGFATLDISQPETPRVLQRVDGKRGYSHLFAGPGKILTSGNIPPQAHFFQVTHSGAIVHEATVGFFFDSGGYGTYQDGFFHSGFSDSYAKFDIAGESVVGEGSSGRADRDEDFGTVLGNLVLVGDDHGSGSALVAHQEGMDLLAPVVEWTHPPDGAVDLPLTSRFGLSFSDTVDASSLSDATLYLQDDLDQRIPAQLSMQFGLVNLSPLQNLERNRTYTLVAEGITDVAGNAGPRFEATFQTGEGYVGVSPAAVIPQVNTTTNFGDYPVLPFSEGSEVYSDRDYTFTDQYPLRFEGQPFIQTANNDKFSFSSAFLSFELAAPSEIHVLFDSSASATPDWLDAFVPTGEVVGNTDTTFDVYAKHFSPGTIELGGNNAPGSNGADSMYSVVIIPDPLLCDLTLSPSLPGTTTLTSVGPSTATFDWMVGEQVHTDAGASLSVDLQAGRHPVVVTVKDLPRIATCSGVQVVHRPLAMERPQASRPLIFFDGDVINVNPDQGSVTRMAGNGNEAGARLWETQVGGHPTTLAPDPSGNLWVVLRDSAELVMLDPVNGGEIQRHPLPPASRPWGIVFSPEGKAWVTLQAKGQVARLNGEGQVEDVKSVIPFARGLGLHGGKLFVTRFISPAHEGQIAVVDPTSLEVTDTIALAPDEGPDTEASGRGVPNYLSPLFISPDGGFGWVVGKKDNNLRGLYRDGEELTFESRVRAMAAQIDLSTLSEVDDARLDINDRDMPQSLAFSPLGDLAYIASQGSDQVDVFDAISGRRVSQFETGNAPQGLVFDPSSGHLASHDFLSRQISVFDARALNAGTSNYVAPLWSAQAPAGEALDPTILMGKRIFYNAADERMSKDGYISCASCHLDGGHDGRVWDFTQVGEGLRNTISLRGRAGLGHGRVHWTANFDEIQDFENDIRGGFGGKGFLSDVDFESTADPLGAPKAGLSSELDALAAYVSSLMDFPLSPHRAEDGRLTEAGRRGRAVFQQAQCHTCHAGSAFTDLQRHDVGTADESSGLGQGVSLDGVGFDTPTLLGIWNTPPYLHNGSASSLADVLARHGEIPDLSPEEDDDLIAYLLQLDGQSAAPEIPCEDADECSGGGGGNGNGSGNGGEDNGGTSEGEVPGDNGGTDAPSGCGCTSQNAFPGAGLFMVFSAGMALMVFRRRRYALPTQGSLGGNA